MFIEHGIRATIHAPIDQVWAVLGSFGDMSWLPGITSGTLIGDETVHLGSVREMRTLDGSTIRERLDGWGPGRSFTYSFLLSPIPVNSSRTTVTATPAEANPDSATTVTWHGQFDVGDDETGRTVEHLNRDIVWPVLVAALASTLGADHTINQPDPQ